VDPKYFFFFPISYLSLNFGSGLFMKITFQIKSFKHHKKLIFGSGLLRKIYLNCRSSKHCKKLFFLSVGTFYSFVFVSWKQNLTWIRNSNQESELITDPDPNLQIVSDLVVGSRSTTEGQGLLLKPCFPVSSAPGLAGLGSSFCLDFCNRRGLEHSQST
jgi:hypothetical protein